MRWRESTHGQHIELGIAEGNLVGLLGELGATWSRDGQPLLPIGTIYDPFVNRALEPWSFGIYAGGQSILVGTPSGVTLAPEGGAHQSIITPSVGLEQPRCVAWEPAFGQDLEWTLLDALGRLGRRDGDLGLLPPQHAADRPGARRGPRRPGGARAAAPRTCSPAATCCARRSGAPARDAGRRRGDRAAEVLAAADELDGGRRRRRRRLPHLAPTWCSAPCRRGRGCTTGDDAILDALFPAERAAPIVTVLDGHPHTLAFLSAIRGAPIACLGVDDFGQSGDVDDLYRYFGIDADTIVGAAADLAG